MQYKKHKCNVVNKTYLHLKTVENVYTAEADTYIQVILLQGSLM